MLDTDTELDIIFNSLDDYAEAGKFNIINLVFSQVDINELPPVISLGFLSSTFLYQNEIKMYESLAKQFYKKHPHLALSWSWING